MWRRPQFVLFAIRVVFIFFPVIFFIRGLVVNVRETGNHPGLPMSGLLGEAAFSPGDEVNHLGRRHVLPHHGSHKRRRRSMNMLDLCRDVPNRGVCRDLWTQGVLTRR
jgi:hypothetical protein